MAERHPYSPGPGGITSAVTQFRNSFPKTVNAETLKQLGIAPKNESYLINVLRVRRQADGVSACCSRLIKHQVNSVELRETHFEGFGPY